MRAIYLEDTIEKEYEISRELERNGIKEIDWVMYMEDGLELIQKSIDEGNPYDVVVTDMYYPLHRGGEEAQAGEAIIEKLKELGINIPVIVASSQDFRIPDAFGTIHYSENSNWEDDLRVLIKELK